MNTRTPLLAGVLCLAFSPLAVLAQRPTQASSAGQAAEKPWPSVGFTEVLDGTKNFTGMNKSGVRPGDERGDAFMDLVSANDGTNRIFLAERAGGVWIMQDGKILPEPFLDITALTTMDGERGLLSLAFPPDYKTKGHFYVLYTDKPAGSPTVARYKVDPANPNRALPDSGEILLSVLHPRQSNHNGGRIAFGKDGMLYWSIGDGGGQHDMNNNGQNLKVGLGKMLRLDTEGKPDAGKTYHVPSDNPFLTTPDALPELWAVGLRNPFRFSFDSANGDLYIGNVGQDAFEQIYYLAYPSKGGTNFGWSIYEGTHDHKPEQPSGTTTPIVYPVAEFAHAAPQLFKSIAGGYVYRGTEFPDWQGTYFFSDWSNSQLWAMRRDADGKWETHRVDGEESPIKGTVTFGVDEKQNLYATSFYDGKIYKLVDKNTMKPAAPAAAAPTAPASTTSAAK